jgi:hypothetical protein
MVSVILTAVRCVAVVACAALVVPASAAVLRATQASIYSTFNAANAGDTIALVGAFDSLYLANRSFSRVVTLDASQAQFSGTLTLDHVNQIALSGGTFNIATNGAYAKGVAVYGGVNVYFDNVTVNGSGNGLIDQFGIAANGTRNLQVTHSKLNGLFSGIATGALTGGFLAANTFTGSTSDGIDIADSHGVTASGNKCVGGHPGPGAHPDCIQLWSVAGHALESDIIVINNSATGPTQGFTDFDAGIRIRFSGNTVASSYIAGVACYACVDSIITNNALSTLAGSAYQTQVVIRGGSNNIISGNLVAAYAAPRSAAASLGAELALSDYSPPAFGDELFLPPTDPAGGSLLASSLAASGASSVSEDDPAAVPEPSSWALFITGFAAVGIARRRALAAGRTA